MKRIYTSPLGSVILMSCHGKLVYANWDSPECLKKLAKIESHVSDSYIEEDDEILNETQRQLEEYFAGKRKLFNLPLEFTGTEFQKQTWQNMVAIPYGQTVTYKELATAVARPKGARAIANICGANPIAIIIPCHRVVASNGKPGGYTGGVDKKLALLELEKF